MPQSISSSRSDLRSSHGDYYYDEDDAASIEQREEDDTVASATPTSPTTTFRKLRRNRTSDLDLPTRANTERSSLLGHHHGPSRSYSSMPASIPGTPRPYSVRHNSGNPVSNTRLRHSRAGSFSQSFSQRLVNALGSERRAALGAFYLHFASI